MITTDVLIVGSGPAGGAASLFLSTYGVDNIVLDIDLPMAGAMDIEGSTNIVFEADLSRYVAHRPSVLYWVLQPGAQIGGIGAGGSLTVPTRAATSSARSSARSA
ncbi:FAD-dependent monooxygenase [Kribbella sindirgiensis]|uniref:FAD-binding domain-containing protein n=1 Tax=Kribbella sindirgiensis TaxID=1124744 RepID=A0A4V2M6C7_9ACTN|nr:FAD-dependent monooxygenase [Kribbella sindirgiensis]TCC43112.1 hypothetical protein E0H50_01070 [Kribbella sindirgiensis]